MFLSCTEEKVKFAEFRQWDIRCPEVTTVITTQSTSSATEYVTTQPAWFWHCSSWYRSESVINCSNDRYEWLAVTSTIKRSDLSNQNEDTEQTKLRVDTHVVISRILAYLRSSGHTMSTSAKWVLIIKSEPLEQASQTGAHFIAVCNRHRDT